MGDVGDFWRDWKDHKREVKALRYRADTEAAKAEGWEIVRHTEWHWLVENRFQWWPSTGRWLDNNSTKSGWDFNSLKQAVMRHRAALTKHP